jgi:methyl-accepting chemotaxis protein
MSDSETFEAVTVDSEGVAVIKRYEEDEFPVPAIAFNFESGRGENVTVTLYDDVPEEVEVDDLGFHPEYGSEFWDVEEDEIRFERDLAAGEEYTTVYGIRATGTDNIDTFLTTPSLEVDPPAMDEADLAGDDPVRDVIAGESDEVPGLENEEEDVDTLELNDPNQAGASAAAETEEGDREQETTAASVEVDSEESVGVSGDSLVEGMANELRENDVSKEDVKLLRRAFKLAAEGQGSVRAKVDKLQQDVSDVVAYTDALEEFIDENGTAEDIAEFEERFAEVSDNLDAVESRLDEQADEIEELGGTVASVQEDATGVDETVTDLDDTVSEFEERIDEIVADIEGLREQVSTSDVDEEIERIEEDIEQLEDWREQLSSVIGGE